MILIEKIEKYFLLLHTNHSKSNLLKPNYSLVRYLFIWKFKLPVLFKQKPQNKNDENDKQSQRKIVEIQNCCKIRVNIQNKFICISRQVDIYYDIW